MDKELERCLIFFDHANIYQNLKPIGGRIDYIKFKEIVSKGFHLVGAFIYLGISKRILIEKQKFFRFLKKAKFVIQSKPLQESPDGRKKQKGIDVFMYHEIVDLMDAYDKSIIISGDSDFIDAVKEVKKFNKMVDVWSFKRSLSYKWKDAVGLENIYYIDDILDEIEFKSGN